MEYCVTERAMEEEDHFFLLLFPRVWALEGIRAKLLSACAQVISSNKQGNVIRKEGFDRTWFVPPFQGE